MRAKSWIQTAVAVSLISSLILVSLLSACQGEQITELEPAPITEEGAPTSEVPGFDTIQTAVASYLNSSSSWNIKAENLFMLLNDDDADNDPFIISVRKPEHYAKGHVPGAVNIPFGDLIKPETLAGLPRDRQIVVYCYTGHSGSQATAILGTLGFDVVNLLHGMSSWTRDTEVAPSRFDPEKHRKEYEFETIPNETTETCPFPTIDKTTWTAAQNYTPKNITSEDLFMLLNDDDTDNDPFIISVRKPEHYAMGHIPGAVNIGFTSLSKKETLAKLPPDRPIVVYCYTGHTGSQATALLNVMGYDATNLKFGMCSWTRDTEVAPKCFNNETASMDYEAELAPNVFVPVYESGEAAGFDAIQTAVAGYLGCGSSWNIKAEDLFMLLNDDDADNDPFIISVRKPEHYAKGHVPGAVNIPFSDIARDGTLGGLPRDRQIVVYCYTGHSGSQATAILGTLGFDVVNLLHGMSSWTRDTEVAPSRFDPEKHRKEYEFETTPNEATETCPFPTTGHTAKSAAQSYTKPKNITSEDLFMLLNDDDTDNDPFIISVRKPEHYAMGHIPGAVNIGFTSLSKKETLAKLPPDRPIVVYCYTGHTGSQATALLNIMGYDATNLKFGMCSWTRDTEVAPKCFNNETASMDYEAELAPNVFVPREVVTPPPADEEAPLAPEEVGLLTGDTCVACHTSESLIEETAQPVEEEEEPEEASGEG